MAISVDPKRNHLLAALPPAEWARWLPRLEPLELPLGAVLYEAGGKMSHVYFATDSIVSLLYRLSAGHDCEVNLKAELEIMLLHEKFDLLRDKQWEELPVILKEQLKLLSALTQPAA